MWDPNPLHHVMMCDLVWIYIYQSKYKSREIEEGNLEFNLHKKKCIYSKHDLEIATLKPISFPRFFLKMRSDHPTILDSVFQYNY